MPLYDLELEPEKQQAPKKGPGCAFGGWIAFLVLLAAVGFVGYRTWFFYGKIRSGEIVDLPQFNDRLTISGSTVIGALEVDRTEVESDRAPSVGPAREEAELVIVEFADYECPYSKEEAAVARRIMTKYGSRVRFEFRDFPIEELHQNATQAAIAGRCAQEQGKFWPFHDKAFNSSPSLSYAELVAMGNEIGMDPRQFERCLLDGRYRDDVAADVAKSKELGITGTPTFFLNGRRIDGAIPEDIFEDVIDKMLAASAEAK